MENWIDQKDDDSRSLPVITVAGVDFYVDAVKQTLTDTKNAENTIRTLDMEMVDGHLEFSFDKLTRNIKASNLIEKDSKRFENVWLRPLEVYDTKGAEILLGHESILIPKDLPIIDIEGVKFLWDNAHSRLLQQDIPWNVIAKNDMQQHDKSHGFYFDTQKKVVPFPHELERYALEGGLPTHINFVHQKDVVRRISEIEQLKQEHRPRKRLKIK